MAQPNGVWFKTHVYREGRFLKADVFLVVAGHAKKFTVGIDMARVARAVKEYHDKTLHGHLDGGKNDGLSRVSGDCIGGDCDCIGGDCIGGWFSSIAKVVKKVTRSKLVTAISHSIKSVVKSKVTGSLAGALAVAFPPVGVPAAAAYAGANAALAAVERGNEVRRAAANLVRRAKASGKPAVLAPETRARLKAAVALEAKARASIRKVVETSKYSGDPRKKADAARVVRVLQIVAKNRAEMRAIPMKNRRTAAKVRAGQMKAPHTRGLVVDERGHITRGTFAVNPLGKGAALLYQGGKKKALRGTYTKVGGCIGCSLGTNPWPNLR